MVTAKRIIVCVTNDLTHDQRVHKVCTTLDNAGYHVTLIGRKMHSSVPVNRSYKTKRFELFFTKGAMFYAAFNLRLFFYLLFADADIFHANDLDTLPACYFAALLKGKKVVYDSHEYFTEVPELVNRKFTRSIWLSLERFIFPRLKHVFTVNDSIASIYRKTYNVDVKVLRNVPFLEQTKKIEANKKSRSALGLPTDRKLIILQGAWINVDRGGEEAVLMMQNIRQHYLLIVGGGDRYSAIMQLAHELKLEDSIRFYPKLPFEELRQLTMSADLGISLDKGTNLNYLYSLPNKIFDYIHAVTPCFVTSMPEVANITKSYEVGRVIESMDPVGLAKEIDAMLMNESAMDEYQKNCMKAREELNWEKESEVLLSVYKML
jgi:glycosyltransferase involved in cell wall biosynthesis